MYNETPKQIEIFLISLNDLNDFPTAATNFVTDRRHHRRCATMCTQPATKQRGSVSNLYCLLMNEARFWETTKITHTAICSRIYARGKERFRLV